MIYVYVIIVHLIKLFQNRADPSKQARSNVFHTPTVFSSGIHQQFILAVLENPIKNLTEFVFHCGDSAAIL